MHHHQRRNASWHKLSVPIAKTVLEAIAIATYSWKAMLNFKLGSSAAVLLIFLTGFV